MALSTASMAFRITEPQVPDIPPKSEADTSVSSYNRKRSISEIPKLPLSNSPAPPSGPTSPRLRPLSPSSLSRSTSVGPLSLAQFRSTSVSDISTLRYTAGRVSNPSSLPKCAFYLCNDVLIVAHPKNKAKVAAIQLVTTWVCTEGLFPRLAELVSLEKTFLVFFATDEEQKAWVAAMNDAIADLVTKPDMNELREQYVLRRRKGVLKVIAASSADADTEDTDEDGNQVAINPLFALRGGAAGGRPGLPQLKRTASSAAVTSQ